MKEEAKKWWTKAEGDLIKARDNFKMGHYDLASFLCQQSVEKALKAALIENKKVMPKIHDLVKLAKLVNINSNLLDDCERLTYVYVDSRYPDTETKKYTKAETEKDLEIAEKIIIWIEKNQL